MACRRWRRSHDGLVEVAGPAGSTRPRELLDFAANGGLADGIVRLPPADPTQNALTFPSTTATCSLCAMLAIAAAA